MKRRARRGRGDSDEAYVIGIVDELLGIEGLRQHRFPFLLGDPGKSGRRAALAVDAYYPTLNLVIEFNEVQHRKAIAHFDKPHRLTVSGVHRGEQRRLYDQRRASVLPEHGLRLLVISSDLLRPGPKRRLARDRDFDREVIACLLSAHTLLHGR